MPAKPDSSIAHVKGSGAAVTTVNELAVLIGSNTPLSQAPYPPKVAAQKVRDKPKGK
jgi:hypothetical protein